MTRFGARETYSNAIDLPAESRPCRCSIAADTEKSFCTADFSLKLDGRSVQTTTSILASFAQFFTASSTNESREFDFDPSENQHPMFRSVVPSRDRRSQIASSGSIRLLREKATLQGAPFSSRTNVSELPRETDTRQNSIFSVGPSCSQSPWCRSKSSRVSHKREPQPRMAMRSAIGV